MSDLVEWLLASPTPSIRYLTLTRLLGRPDTDVDVAAAGEDIMMAGPVPAMLAEQTASGQWAGEHSYYTPKYTSTHWTLMLLVELAADGADPRLAQGVEYMLDATGDDRLTWQTPGAACFWGNLLRYAVHAGYAADPRIESIAAYLAGNLNEERVCRCPINDGLACAWGAARALWGLAALPNRSPAVESAIQSGLHFLFESGHSPVNGDYPTPGKIHRIWNSLNFPLFYQADGLFLLRVAADLDALDRVEPALEWLAGRRQKNGRWRGASPFAGRTWSGLRDTDRWVSLHAASILQRAYGGVIAA